MRRIVNALKSQARVIIMFYNKQINNIDQSAVYTAIKLNMGEKEISQIGFQTLNWLIFFVIAAAAYW